MLAYLLGQGARSHAGRCHGMCTVALTVCEVNLEWTRLIFLHEAALQCTSHILRHSRQPQVSLSPAALILENALPLFLQVLFSLSPSFEMLNKCTLQFPHCP